MNLLLRSITGVTPNLRLDCYQRPTSRTSELVGSSGRISFDDFESQLKIFSSGQPEPVEVIDISDTFEGNNMFVSEIDHLFECIDNDRLPVLSLTEGNSALKVAPKRPETKKKR